MHVEWLGKMTSTIVWQQAYSKMISRPQLKNASDAIEAREAMVAEAIPEEEEIVEEV